MNQCLRKQAIKLRDPCNGCCSNSKYRLIAKRAKGRPGEHVHRCSRCRTPVVKRLGSKSPRAFLSLRCFLSIHHQGRLLDGPSAGPFLFVLDRGADGSICVQWRGFSRALRKVWKAFESLHSTWYKRVLKMQVIIARCWALGSEYGCISSSESSVCAAMTLQANFCTVSVHLSLLMMVYLKRSVFILSVA